MIGWLKTVFQKKGTNPDASRGATGQPEVGQSVRDYVVLATDGGPVIAGPSGPAVHIPEGSDPRAVLMAAGIVDEGLLRELIELADSTQGDESLDGEQELAALRPRLIPTGYFEAGLPGPRVDLALPGLSLSWVLLLDAQRMLYVTDDMVGRWVASGVDWRRRALANLLPGSRDDPAAPPFTHHRSAGDGTIEWAVSMHEDGLGSSRLLLRPQFARLFPRGYRIALPQVSIGMAMSNAATPEAEADFRELVEHVWSREWAPFSKSLYDPDLLRVREPGE